MHVSFINVVAFGLTLFLCVFTFNVSRVTHHRLELQYGVDAAVISAATVKARGMNTVTAMNHLIGELHAFTILHDSIGGRRADAPGRFRPIRGEWVQQTNGWLWASRSAARFMGARTMAYRDVRRNINANLALFQAKMTLKERLTQLYWLKAAVLFKGKLFPPIRPVCELLVATILDPIDLWIQHENTVLNATLQFAIMTAPIKMLIRSAAIPFLRFQQQAIIAETPRIAHQTAVEVADQYGVTIHLNQRDLELPLVPDPMTGASRAPVIPSVPPRRRGTLGRRARQPRNQIAKTTQIARAAFPWVIYHRQGITRITDWALPVSRFSSHYRWATFNQSVEQTRDLRSRIYALPVMRGYPAPNKGFAVWTESGLLSEELFSVVGVGTTRAPSLMGTDFFGSQGGQSLAISQATIYNGNAQVRRDRLQDVRRQLGGYRRQPSIGYDTLNFSGRVSEVVNDPRITRFPEIKLNWQSKLVPISATHLQKRLGGLDEHIQRQLAEYDLSNDALATH